MIKFSALNELSSSDEEDGDNPMLATREAQEEEAYSLYNRALKCRTLGEILESQHLFRQVLEKQFIVQAKAYDEKNKGPLRPALTLKYLVYKNLASIAFEEKDYKSSMESYLEAMTIDATDVNMWYKMGMVAWNLPNYVLSRLCFEEGLKCNSNHWPCLDKIITVMYTLNDYANCLYYISQALEKECYYLKGLVFKDQIYKEDPSLRAFCEGYFRNCDPSIHTASYGQEEARKLVQESLDMREIKRSLYKPHDLPVIQLKYPIKEMRWKAVGESLIYMYDYISSADPIISMGCRIDISQYINTQENVQTAESEQTNIPAMISLPEANCTSTTVSGNTSTSQAVSQKGLLPLSLTTEKGQEALASDKQMEIENEESPVGLGANISAGVHTETRPVDQVVFPDTQNVNRTPKRKRFLTEITDLGGKRRSSRVRNTATKRPQDSVNYQELLQKFLPSSLLGEGKFDDQDDDSGIIPQGKNNGDHNYGQTMDNKEKDSNADVPKELKLCFLEREDICSFIANNQNNGGIIDLFYKYVVQLGRKSNFLWPRGLSEIYLAAFTRLRKHISMPNLFSHDSENKYTKEVAEAVLFFIELKVDHWYANKGHCSAMSPTLFSKTNAVSPSIQGVHDFMGKGFHSDFEFLLQMTVRLDILGSDWLVFTVRTLWLKAKFFAVEGDIDKAVFYMEKLMDIIKRDGDVSLNIVVPNCSFLKIISSDSIRAQLESLQRCQSLEEVQRLYENEEYLTVVDLLVVTFNQPHTKGKASADGGIPERHAQLILLQDSLWKLQNYLDCVRWSEVSFNEAIQQYMNASTSSARSDWADTISCLLSGLDRIIKMDRNSMSYLEEQKLIRLTQNLIGLVSLQMEHYDYSSDQSALTILPWVILYRLIYNEELKIKTLAVKSFKQAQMSETKDCVPVIADENDSKIKLNSSLVNPYLCSGMPSSLMLLFKAHECLGRRSWCCAWEGALLLLSVDVIMEEIQNFPGGIHPYHEDLEAGLEQCFYCLYGHPNKRTKAKHLQEHSVPQITLTWERALQIFQYFRPATLPEFDSYRTSTVSVEFENLLRRISMLVPPEEDPTSRADGYIAYIEGGIDKCPSLSLDHLNPSIVAKDLYYLLGDYYFKSKEFGKAIRFYLLDICINPDRLDSWAGMALSRSSQLDHKLCSYELKKDALIYRKASAALRCFEHALKINPNSTSLWIEYGSLAYILHSHASRQLKQDGFGEDIQELLRNKKIEMLNVAHQCFIAANSCHEDGMEPEEVWLHHYMLGKIAEKCQEDPEIYLNHYEKALNYLHADNARYPRKIQYHNPPELSIEALEVYYRLHASCLKYLLKYENTGIEQGTLKVIRNSITAVASGPFANFQENQEEEREEPLTFSRSGDEKIVEDSHPYQHRKYVTDHNYYGAEQVYQNIEVQLNSYGNQGHPASSDLSSDFQDDAIIKELLDSIVSVISEHFEDAAKNSASNGDADFLNEGGLISNNHLTGIEADDVIVDTLHNVILPCTISSECEALEIDASGSTCDDLKIDPLTFVNLEKQILVTTSDDIIGYQKTGQETNPLQSYHEKAIYLDVQEDKKVGTMLTDNSSSRSSELTIDFKDTEYLKIKEEECNFYGPLNFIVDPEVIYVIDDLVSQVDSLVRLGNIFKFSRMVKDCNSAYGNDRKFKESGQGEKIHISQNLFRNPKSVKSALNHTDSLMHQKSCMNETNNVLMQNNFGKGMLEDVASFSVEAQMANSVTAQSHSDFMTYQEVNNDDTVKHFHNMLEKTKPEIEELVKLCMNAMRECLQRYVQHFKSLFRMAHYYCFSNKNKNLQWAREILLAATPSVSGYSPLPGLFAERKNTNFFNGIWHVPSNEIDRAGSFGAHMYRSVFLLIDVLWQQRDYNMLLYLTQQLHRTPDFGKKYMRDTDRTFLATESYRRCITILREQMNSLLQEEPPPEESRLTCCLLEIYRSCQTLLKAGIYPEETNELLSEAYSMYKLGEVDPYPSVLEQAIKFCQLQLGKSFPTTHETSRYVLPNKLCAYPTDEANTAVISSTSNCYTPDAWQREFAKSLMLPILPVPVEGQAKSDCHGVGKSVLIIPVTNNTSVRNGTDSCFSKCVPLSNNTQVANVEKSSNENLQTCSLAYLPLPPTFSSGKIACSSNNTYQENATVLSCQALECYDIFATLMKASGYHATPHTPSSISADSSSQSLISKQKEL